MISFKVNSKPVSFDGDDDTPLLWVLRDHVKLTGTKFGCGVGQCGACTVHVDGRAQRSCMTPAAAINGKSITTIEGLASADVRVFHSVRIQNPDTRFPILHDDIDSNMTNLCRCGTYVRIRSAIHRAAELIEAEE